MIAFVFTGGGSRGPLQAGAVRALLEAGIQPDFVVGSSAGALNATFLAAWGPSLDTIDRLAQAWLGARKGNVMPGGIFGVLRRVLTRKNSLLSNSGIRAMLEANLPPTVRTYGDLRIPCYVTASDLRSRRLYLFGEDPTGPLIDAAMASATIPVVYPPLDYHGLQLVDGGVVDNVPTTIAMDKGASTIYLINVGYGGEGVEDPAVGMIPIFERTIGTFLAQSLFEDLERGELDPTVDLNHIFLGAVPNVGMLDLSRTADMLEAGYRDTLAYLENPDPRRADPAVLGREPGPPPSVPGARVLPIRNRRR